MTDQRQFADPPYEAVETTERYGFGRNQAARLVTLIAGAAMTIIGFIAAAQLDWGGSGLDAPAVTVADMAFRPWIAIATILAGVLALLAGALVDAESKLFLGALYLCGGIAIVVTNPTIQSMVLTDRYGWMFVIVGLILLIAGLLVGPIWSVRRERVDRTVV